MQYRYIELLFQDVKVISEMTGNFHDIGKMGKNPCKKSFVKNNASASKVPYSARMLQISGIAI